MVLTFFGHRHFQESSQIETHLLDLFETLSNGQPIIFYLGGYGNFDMFALRCAKRYQSTHDGVKVIFVTPYLSEKYSKLTHAKENYDGTIYPELESVPYQYAILKRNEWMVENADHIVFYVAHAYGGAYKAYLHAKRKKKAYTNLSNIALFG